MPISLENIQRKLSSRLKAVDSAFERHVLQGSVKFRTDRYALQDGLISNLWQSWCVFCREVVVASVQGAQTQAGAITTSPYSTHSEMEIAFIAKKLAAGESFRIVKPLVGNYLEPTWGDATKINAIVSGVGCSNQKTLLTAFGVASRIEDLRLCRNSCAHISGDMINRINLAKVRYLSTSISHPSELMFWEDPKSNDFLWKSWIQEIEFVSSYAIG